MKNYIKRNDALTVTAISTGLTEDHLSERIINRLEATRVLKTNSFKERPLTWFCVKEKLDMDQLLSKIFFPDELSSELSEIAKAIFIIRQRELTKPQEKKMLQAIRSTVATLTVYNNIGRVKDQLIEIERGTRYVKFRLSVEEQLTPIINTSPQEFKMVYHKSKVTDLEIYYNGEPCYIPSKLYNSISEKILNKLITIPVLN